LSHISNPHQPKGDPFNVTLTQSQGKSRSK
jgi:hypothetical protein